MNIQIATAAEQQSEVAEQLDRNITEVADKTMDTTREARRSSDVSTELKDMVTSVSTLVSRYRI